MLKVYNTLSRQKEEFTPLTPHQVKMYVCGVTVYDLCHLGHARAYIVFDMIRRYLKHLNFNITYIQNFTDIDDKIIKKALTENVPFNVITERYIAEYFKDFDALNIERANLYPKATDYITHMHTLIKKLIDNGHAYATHGEVYYDVASFKDYGKLSGRKLDDNEAGARVAIDTIKKNPLDFALWKKAKEGEPSWDSPWGPGRPGWHLECSAMSMSTLGESYDIHGGGQDLIFPHHENEIAQSEGATHKPYVKYWLHNGFVNINNEKMSKSLNNFFTIRDILKKYEAEVLRFFILSTHYRSPINFSEDQLSDAQKGLHRLYAAIYENKENNTALNIADFRAQFHEHLQDDFNTAGAFGVLFTLATETNKHKSVAGAALLKELGAILGILQQPQKALDIPANVIELANQRQAAKKNKDFAAADKLRAEITAQGYNVKDTPQGPVLEKI